MKQISTCVTVVLALAAAGPLTADVGQRAPLFDSLDEHLNPVSMADMIDGRPLVLAVGSCT